MPLGNIVSLGIAAWGALLLVVLVLCWAAKHSDQAMDAALESAVVAEGRAEILGLSSSDRPLRTLSVDDAATLLGVSPQTLQVWEGRYGFPTSSLSEALYNQSE